MDPNDIKAVAEIRDKHIRNGRGPGTPYGRWNDGKFTPGRWEGNRFIPRSSSVSDRG